MGGIMIDREMLVLENMKLVAWIINTKIMYIPRGIKRDLDDLYQEGYALLTQAANNFDYTKGYKFSTYATNTIYLGIRSFIDRHAVKKYEYEGFSLENECNNNDEEESVTWKELLESEEYGFDDVIISNELNRVFENSKIKDIDKIISWRMEGYTQKEIAQKLCISQRYVSKKIKQFRDELVSYNIVK